MPVLFGLAENTVHVMTGSYTERFGGKDALALISNLY